MSASQAMIVLASEQLWPNIHGLVHWHQHAGGLSDLCIYYTADKQRSELPAGRLARLCQRLYPDIRVHLPPAPLGIGPQDVQAQIAVWQKELPGRRWVINATGGLKLMFGGALASAAEKDTEVVYRELFGEWFSLHWLGGRVTSEALTVPADETDVVPVRDLIEVQWRAVEQAHWTSSPVEPLDIPALTRAGVATGWNWKRMFRDAGLDDTPQAGFLFERYMGAALLGMGLPNLAANLVLASPDGRILQEIDLAANCRGRLLIFDCKLRAAEEEGADVEGICSQIRQAAETRRILGGLGARLMLVRPNRAFADAELELAKAHDLTVLQRSDAWQPFRRLADFAEIAALPPALVEAETILAEARAQGQAAVFARENWSRRVPNASPMGPIIPVWADLQQCRNNLGQDWIAYEIEGWVWIHADVPPGLPPTQVKKRVLDRFRSLGDISDITLSESRKSVSFAIWPHAGGRKQLELALAQHLHGSLLK